MKSFLLPPTAHPPDPAAVSCSATDPQMLHLWAPFPGFPSSFSFFHSHMDFGAAVGFDGLLGSDLDARQKLYGSGLFKQPGRPPSEDADEWRLINSGGGNKGSAKVAKSSDDCSSVSAPKAAALPLRRSCSIGLSSDSQQNQHMLCFSSPSSPLHKSESQSPALPCFSYASSVYSNYAGKRAVGRVLKLKIESESFLKK